MWLFSTIHEMLRSTSLQKGVADAHRSKYYYTRHSLLHESNAAMALPCIWWWTIRYNRYGISQRNVILLRLESGQIEYSVRLEGWCERRFLVDDDGTYKKDIDVLEAPHYWGMGMRRAASQTA